MNERRSGDSELRDYLDGKFGDVIAALNEHKLENMKDITELKGRAKAFDKYMDDNMDSARDRKNHYWEVFAAASPGLAAIIWHVVKHFGGNK